VDPAEEPAAQTRVCRELPGQQRRQFPHVRGGAENSDDYNDHNNNNNDDDNNASTNQENPTPASGDSVPRASYQTSICD